MPVLQNYHAFHGVHWETGTIHNYYAARGVKAPHTGQPYSEALLMGVSGGAVMGYFTFVYEGVDPQARILTRNTFDPWDTMLSRLGVVQNVAQTTKPEKALKNLLEVLQEGVPAIVWADAYTMPYNSLPYAEMGMWWMAPLIVFGYDETADSVHIASHSTKPLTVSTSTFAAARARVKEDKFRLMTLEAPDEGKLVTAVQKGIWDCIKLFTEHPPKGGKNNFGFAAYNWFAEQLTKPKARQSWEKIFPAGDKMYAGLTSLFSDIRLFGKNDNADREGYAQFLDEASLILHKPALKEVANSFRQSGAAWDTLSEMVLPEEVAPFKEARELMLHKNRLFWEQGAAAIEEIRGIEARLKGIKTAVSAQFPLTQPEVVALRQKLAGQILAIHDIEKEAIIALQAAMA